MRGRAGLMSGVAVGAAALLASGAMAFEVFNDASDDGTPDPPIAISASGTTVHVWLRHGNGATSDPAELCAGNGTGDEVCGWDTLIEATGGVRIDAFDEAPDVVGNLVAPGTQGNRVHANGGNPIDPAPLPEKVGTLTVSAVGPGELQVTGRKYVTSDLTAPAIPGATLAVAVDSDSDGALDADDGCPLNPAFANEPDTGGIATPANPAANIPDGISDVCQCGDVTDDGKVNGNDATLITFACINFQGAFPDGCDQSYESPKFVFEKCHIGGGQDCNASPDNCCNGNDATIITFTTIGLPPGIQNVCPAYMP